MGSLILNAQSLGCVREEWTLNYLGPLRGKSLIYWNLVTSSGKDVQAPPFLISLPITFPFSRHLLGSLKQKCKMTSYGNYNHLLKWEVVCRSIEMGDLGFRHLLKQNLSFLAKWLWKFMCELDSPWHAILHLKYGLQNNG